MAEKAQGLAKLKTAFLKEFALADVGHAEDPRLSPVCRVVVLRNLWKLPEHVDHGTAGKVHHKPTTRRRVCRDRAQRFAHGLLGEVHTHAFPYKECLTGGLIARSGQHAAERVLLE